ncbi:hypothetical protein FRC06_007335 [Ceratobasidium sp. 370]|nr:hypothetical protein FRC06_007335 [Ceratobasidium sp. 370]
MPRLLLDLLSLTTSSALHANGLPLASTERQNRKANKQTAAEEARAKAKAQVQAAKDKDHPSASSCVKGKQPVHLPPQDESEDNEEVSNPPACQKVKAGPHMHARIMSVEPDSESERAPTARSKKGKGGQVAKASAKHKADEESAAEAEAVSTQASKAPSKQGKAGQATQTMKRKEPVTEEEEPREEVEEPQTKKCKTQPHMRPPRDPKPASPSEPLPPDTPASQPAEGVIQVSSNDPPEPGSSRMPIAVNSSDPASELVGTISDSGHRIVAVMTIKIPRNKKTMPASNRALCERKK